MKLQLQKLITDKLRSQSRTAATSKIEYFVTIAVN